MILGVVSDTHNRFSNIESIIDLFNSKKVDTVIHTGDITKSQALDRFHRLDCPLIGVFGNNDIEEEGLEETAKKNGFIFQNPPFLLEIAGREICILHEPDNLEKIISSNPSLDLIIHGHTHRFRNENISGVKILNPGESAGFLKGKNAVGILELSNLNFKRIFF